MKCSGANDKKAQVAFKLQDVLCPEQEVILAHLEGSVEVIGKVRFFSDGEDGKEQFAIVEVPGINVPLVVPRNRLNEVSQGLRNQETIKSLTR